MTLRTRLLLAALLLVPLLAGCPGSSGGGLRVLDLSASPDGKTLVVSAFAQPDRDLTLVYDCRSRRLLRQVQDRDLVQEFQGWEPGGKHLLVLRGYASLVTPDREGLFLVDPRRGSERRISDLESTARAAMSPDGEEIIYSLREHIPGKRWGEGVTSTYRVPVQSQFFTLDVPVITGCTLVGTRAGRRTGYEIVLDRWEPSAIVCLHVPGGRKTVWPLPPLTRGWSLSPGGERLAALVPDRSGVRGLVLDLATGAKRLSRPIWGTPIWTAWSSDGRSVACYGGAGLSLLDAATGGLDALIPPRDNVHCCAWVGNRLVLPRGGELVLVDRAGHESPFCRLPGG